MSCMVPGILPAQLTLVQLDILCVNMHGGLLAVASDSLLVPQVGVGNAISTEQLACTTCAQPLGQITYNIG